MKIFLSFFYSYWNLFTISNKRYRESLFSIFFEIIQLSDVYIGDCKALSRDGTYQTLIKFILRWWWQWMPPLEMAMNRKKREMGTRFNNNEHCFGFSSKSSFFTLAASKTRFSGGKLSIMVKALPSTAHTCLEGTHQNLTNIPIYQIKNYF